MLLESRSRYRNNPVQETIAECLPLIQHRIMINDSSMASNRHADGFALLMLPQPFPAETAATLESPYSAQSLCALLRRHPMPGAGTLARRSAGSTVRSAGTAARRTRSRGGALLLRADDTAYVRCRCAWSCRCGTTKSHRPDVGDPYAGNAGSSNTWNELGSTAYSYPTKISFGGSSRIPAANGVTGTFTTTAVSRPPNFRRCGWRKYRLPAERPVLPLPGIRHRLR